MQHRRTVLKLWTAGVLAWLWPGAARAAVPLPMPLPGPLPVPAGHGMYLVNGWLLTEADLRRLGLDDL